MTFYAHGCAGGYPPLARQTLWVCEKCLPGFVPSCALCGETSTPVAQTEGFVGYGWGAYCPACVSKVQAAGPWRERRARATEARRDALLARHPELVVVKHAPSLTQLAGQARGRAVQVRLRRAARRYAYERFIFHVELRAELPAGPIDLLLPFAPKHGITEPRVTIDRGRWLRVGFMHLGKLDVLDALDALLEAARSRDLHASASDDA